MIDLRSDTVTFPSPEMKQFIIDAPLGDDVYAEDPSINQLEKMISQLFDKEAALFVPSGTMANLVSVLSQCNRGDEILLGNKSHIFFYEAGGISSFGGMHSHQLANNSDGTINIHDIKNGIRKTNNVHFPITKLLCLENTHNLCGGHPIDEEYTSSVANIIKPFNIKLHIDGARIFNAAVALKTTVKNLVRDADSVSCCLSKGLSCPAGSLVIGSSKMIGKARRIRKALGGGMRQAGVLAAAGIYALNNMVDRLYKDHDNAFKLASALEQIDTIKINIKNIKTNIVYFDLKEDIISDQKFIDELIKNNIKIDSKGNQKFRAVTHCGFTENDIDKVITTIKSII